MSTITNIPDPFVIDHRTDGEPFTKLADDRPDWVYDMVYDLHGGMLPDDWTFQVISQLWDAIHEYDDLDDARDNSGEIADACTEYRTWHLLEWAKSNLDLVDDALDEHDPSADEGIASIIQRAMFIKLDGMVHQMCDAIEANTEEEE